MSPGGLSGKPLPNECSESMMAEFLSSRVALADCACDGRSGENSEVSVKRTRRYIQSVSEFLFLLK